MPSVPTGITLDYEAPKWGALRLMLDGISNHLDAAGTLERVCVTLDPNRVVIADDGPGYDAALLGLLYSTRRDDPATIGQFGEGLKLVATAALRAGLEFTVRSRDWQAKAAAAPVSFEAAPGEQHTVMQLVWEVAPAERITGSRTILSHPAGLREDVRAAFEQWERMFLPDERRLVSAAWASETPALFVKGVYVRALEGYQFAYNLPGAAVNRDRDMVDLSAEIGAFWAATTDREIVCALLRAAHAAARAEQDLFAEVGLWLQPSRSTAPLWREAFSLTFGKEAVIATGEAASYHATAHGYKPIVLPGRIGYALSCSGVPEDRNVLALTERYGFRPLTEAEAAVIAQAQALVGRADGAGPFPVIAMTSPAPGLLGLADRENGTIAIAEDALRSVESVLPVYLEEHAHLASQAGDLSRDFEAWLVGFGARAVNGGRRDE